MCILYTLLCRKCPGKCSFRVDAYSVTMQPSNIHAYTYAVAIDSGLTIDCARNSVTCCAGVLVHCSDPSAGAGVAEQCVMVYDNLEDAWQCGADADEYALAARQCFAAVDDSVVMPSTSAYTGMNIDINSVVLFVL